jgi:hypothetical protein
VTVRETADANNNLNPTKLGLEYAKNVGTIVMSFSSTIPHQVLSRLSAKMPFSSAIPHQVFCLSKKQMLFVFSS